MALKQERHNEHGKEKWNPVFRLGHAASGLRIDRRATMIGMATTGPALSGLEHLAQSVGDILSTPIGTRVMRRDYGSMLFDLIDQPLNSATRLLIFAATALALRRWEPRLRITRVSLTGTGAEARGLASGGAALLIEGERTDLPGANQRILISAPIRAGGISPTITPQILPA